MAWHLLLGVGDNHQMVLVDYFYSMIKTHHSLVNYQKLFASIWYDPGVLILDLMR